VVGRDRLVHHDRDGRGARQRRQAVEVPDRDRLLGAVDVVGLELLEQAQRRVVRERAVGVHADHDAVAEAIPQRDDVGQIPAWVDADLQAEVAEAPVVEALRVVQQLLDGGPQRQEAADAHLLAALAAEQLVDGQSHGLARDVVERVGDGGFADRACCRAWRRAS